MLIIFDLDDTLIDTSGSITPLKLESALNRLIEAGMQLPSYSLALQELYRIDRSAPSGRHALAEFIRVAQAPEELLEVGLEELYGSSCAALPAVPRRGACELLVDLAACHHQLALVTVGDPAVQQEKMKNAGIDSSLFSKIVVCREPDKGPHYHALACAFSRASQRGVVCGDRISVDLSPAKALGFTTVHVRWGRGLNQTGPEADVDHTVAELEEIREIISMLTT